MARPTVGMPYLVGSYLEKQRDLIQKEIAHLAGTRYLHKKEKTGDEDLLEFAAIQTLLNGGTVYLVEPEKRPGYRRSPV